MEKLAIFVEGQTEQIFVKELIYQIYGYQSVRVIEEKIRGKSLFIRIKEDNDNHYFNYLFLIVNVGTDERVVSAVADNSSNMISKGFGKVIGLRDLYPKRREDEGKVRSEIQKFLLGSSYPDKLKIFLAIMETEAWFLADPNLFQSINPKLTPEYIEEKLGCDLKNQDPETAYKHPATIIKKIYNLIGMKYRKREDDSYKIVGHIDFAHLYFDTGEENKINSFHIFVNEIEGMEY